MTSEISSQSVATPQASISNRESRVATHSHIRGLGLKEDGNAISAGAGSCGWVGQNSAREVSNFAYPTHRCHN